MKTNLNKHLQTTNFTNPINEKCVDKVLFRLNNKGVIEHEKWKDIPEFEGVFQCSTFGRVKSVSRTVKRIDHYIQVSDKILSQYKTSTSYYGIRLSNGKKSINRQTHQLVAMTFLNHKPQGNKIVVDHKDNNPENNLLSNLQVITQRLNASKDKHKGDYTSKYVGVSWKESRKKWRASIYIDGKDKHLGFFKDEEEASKYYQNALNAINIGKEIKVKRRTETSQYKWVYRKGKGWASRIQIGKDRIHLGTFKTELEAHKAYKEAEAIEAKRNYLTTKN